MNLPPLEEHWELPWPRLDVPAYRDAQVGAWSLRSVPLLAGKGYFQAVAVRGIALYTMLTRHGGPEPVTVMCSLPMEIESNAKHAVAASGTVVVMGAGMGLTVFNMLKKPDVERVIVVERDPEVIELLRQGADLDSWEGIEKLSFVEADALAYVPDAPVDLLYADIWDGLGAPEGLSDTQAMQKNVRAKRVGWWGQELHFARWLLEEGHGFPATTERFEQWAVEIGLPLTGPGDEDYVALIAAVAENYPEKVGLYVDAPSPAAQPEVDETDLVESVEAPDGSCITLRRRGDAYGIQVDGREWMATESVASEEALARLPCERMAERANPHVVVAGLGMGFTLRAALDALPADARVTAIEVVPEIVEWNRRYLGTYNGDALSDSRVEIVVGDFADWLEASTEPVDAILLDVDNGPEQLAQSSNAALYSTDGLRTLAARLNPGGLLAVWSAARVGWFETCLDEAGLHSETHAIEGGAAGAPEHVVYLISGSHPNASSGSVGT